MIDVHAEELIPLSEVTKLIPSQRPGKKLSLTTVWRWATSGVRGVTLETVTVGGGRFTSREAVDRFVEACSAGQRHVAPMRTPLQRRRSHQRAERELDRVGI